MTCDTISIPPASGVSTISGDIKQSSPGPSVPVELISPAEIAAETALAMPPVMTRCMVSLTLHSPDEFYPLVPNPPVEGMPGTRPEDSRRQPIFLADKNKQYPAPVSIDELLHGPL